MEADRPHDHDLRRLRCTEDERVPTMTDALLAYYAALNAKRMTENAEPTTEENA